jgi:large subunit ribosomal protein L9
LKVIFKNTNEIKDVSFGYAVNYLLPAGLAVRTTPEEIKKLEIKKLKEKEKKDKQADEASRLFSQFTGKEFIIKAKAGKKGKLHGAITKKDLAKELKLAKDNLILPEPIKKLGKYEVELKFGDKRTKVKIKVEEEKI